MKFWYIRNEKNSEIEREENKKHADKITKKIKSGLIPYLKKKEGYVSCLDREELFYKDHIIHDEIKWLGISEKMLDKLNSTIRETKKLKKEEKEETKKLIREFKEKKSELKSKYRNEISTQKEITKRIIKTGHPYII